VGLESLARQLDPTSVAWQRLEECLVALCEAADDNPPVVQLRARVALDRLEGK
jgi:hypothetical protein